jgi:hypothetical protein
MVLSSRQRRQRSGIILLVVLALITLFASIGVAFVYFSEQEVTKAADQKAGETIKLPDADLLFNYVMRQIIFPTNNNNSALFTHSLLENMYGRSPVGTSSIASFNGLGWRSNTDAGVPAGFNILPIPLGQDNLFRRNLQGQDYSELFHGSLNPSYTYPDHKNPYLGAVAANWTTRDFTIPLAAPARYLQHGPVALTRSFAREMKFRVAYTVTATGATGVEEVRLNPYSNEVFPSGVRHADYWRLNPGGPNLTMLLGDLPNFAAPGTRVYTPNATITCNANGTAAVLNLNQLNDRAHSMRPTPRSNPNFPPPGDLGGDVKNLPPEVKTLVGFNGTTPVFANNDSYWTDIGFPAIPYSNNRKIKPMAAIFIMDNDGKANLNHIGNLRGQDATGTFHASAHGLGPWEINPQKMGISQAELQKLKAGFPVGTSVIRGSHGYANDQDPSMEGVATTYRPLVRGAPYYSPWNLDGTTDGFGPPGQPYARSNPWQLRSDAGLPATDPTYRRFPFFYTPVPTASLVPIPHGYNGFSDGSAAEVLRGGVAKSPLYVPPFAPNQVATNLPSMGATSAFRSFAASNQEALYRANDVGADKIDSDLRKLMPNTFNNPFLRWQLTTVSSDLNSMGVAPGWYGGIPQELLRPDLPPGLARPSLPQREPGALPIAGGYEVPPAALPNIRNGGYSQPVAGSINNVFPAGPAPTYPPSPYPAYLAHGVNGEYQMQIPVAAAPPAPVGVPTTQVFWRSIFGNASRIDLSRQLPDYPLPPNNNAQIDIANPLVRASYKIALQARQKFALELYHAMENLMHPDNLDAKRYVAQLAVNMVDYIDNDDYPTWMPIPTTPTAPMLNSTNVVWGTELPRLLINEVYSEVVNSANDTTVSTTNQASVDYDIRNWVELYNPLETGTPHSAWPDGSNARLNVNNVSVYRLLVSRRDNTTNMRQPTNTIGYANNNTVQANTFKVVYFPANTAVAPSDQNYGNGTSTTNPGFYLVGSTQPPRDTMPGAVTDPAPLNFPAPDLPTNDMTLEEVIDRTQPIQGAAVVDRHPTIILQRLANPYLPHMGMGDPATTTTSEPPVDPTAVFFNPYITVDYVTNHKLNKAVQYNSSGSADDSNPDPDNPGTQQPGPQYRVSIGKTQPYAGLNDYTINAGVVTHNSVWADQSPDRDTATAGLQRLQAQPQHTFLRHNAIETDRRTDMMMPLVAPNPTATANGLAAANTLRLPFDWLVHLDRPPTSPVDLLHVSGYRPHELTQQFNQIQPITAVSLEPLGGGAAAPSYNLNTLGSVIRIVTSGTPFIGTWYGVPYKVKVNDILTATFATAADGSTTRQAQVRVTNVDTTNYQWIEVNTGDVGTIHNSAPTNANEIRIVVPFAHYAPWYRAQQLVAPNATFLYSQSSGMLYRFLEAVAVRNPGIDVGQVRFTSTTANNITVGPGGSSWIQLDSGTNVVTGQQIPSVRNSRLVSTNEALLLIKNGDALANPDNTFSPTTAVGDTVVVNGVRTAVLEIDSGLNRIRVLINDPAWPTGAGTVNPTVVDYAYHSGRQLGKVNVNTMWDIETWKALADVQPMNSFLSSVPYTAPALGTFYNEAHVDRVFRRIYQQRQPGYFYANRLVGSTGLNGGGEDRPFQGMGAADISGPAPFIPVQGIGNTFLSDRYQESLTGPTNAAPRTNDMSLQVPGIAPDLGTGFPGDVGDDTPDRFLRTLFEVGNPGEHHPFRRFELLNKVWNNMTVRSNTFSVWVTIGFFEYDDVNGIGAELGQIQGKNTRYRFFSVVDRTTIDAWLKSWNMHNPIDAQSNAPIASNTLPANINLFMNSNLFPSLDPRQATYPTLNGTPNTMAICNNGAVVGPSIWSFTPNGINPFETNPIAGLNNFWRLVQVESDNGVEIGQIVPSPPGQIYVRLSIPPPLGAASYVIIRPLPVPATVLHWSQLK